MDSDLFLSLGNLNVTNEEENKIEDNQEALKSNDGSDAFLVATKETEDEKNTESDKKEEFANKQFEQDKEDAAPSSESKDSSSTISVFANYLKEEGVLSSELEGYEEADTLEGLKNLMMKQIESERHSNLSDSQRRYLDSIESGVPLNEYEQAEKDISNLESISLEELAEDGQLRFDIMVMDLVGSGLTEAKAISMAQRSFDSGNDQEDSKESIQSLYNRKIEDLKTTNNTRKVEKQATIDDVRNTIDAKDFIMSDIKLSKENKAEILKMMTTQVDTTPEGNPLNEFGKWRKDNGVEAEIILNALYINTNGFKNLGDIKTQVSSQSAKDLEKRLRSLDKEELSRSLQGTSKNSGGYTLQ
jgi:hypothetical protein